jgi:hypothetical protein
MFRSYIYYIQTSVALDGNPEPDDVGVNPCTQRHYRKLIYYLYIHRYMFRSYDHDQAKKYITTLGLLN